jgi:hypothetical protein
MILRHVSLLELPGIALDLETIILKQIPVLFITSTILAFITVAVEWHLHFIFHPSVRCSGGFLSRSCIAHTANYKVSHPKRCKSLSLI